MPNAQLPMTNCQRNLLWLSCMLKYLLTTEKKILTAVKCSSGSFHALGNPEQDILSVFTHVVSIYDNLLEQKNQIIYMRKEFNSQRIFWVNQHGCRFIVLKHQYGRRDVMWKRSIQPNEFGQFPSHTDNLRIFFQHKQQNKLTVTAKFSSLYCDVWSFGMIFKAAAKEIDLFSVNVLFSQWRSKGNLTLCLFINYA